jgi:hypothetical protein
MCVTWQKRTYEPYKRRKQVAPRKIHHLGNIGIIGVPAFVPAKSFDFDFFFGGVATWRVLGNNGVRNAFFDAPF